MRHHSMLGLAALGIYFCISGALLAGTYSGGDGTAGNPYQIDNKADLLELGATPEDYRKCFILTSDINLAGEIFTEAVIAPDTSNSEDGFQGAAFGGVFDGNNYTINNLKITESGNYSGLFGYIASGGQVTHLGIVNIDLEGATYVGGLAGKNCNGDIVSCYVTGIVSGISTIGGLVGWNDGNLTSCYTAGLANGSYFSVGGLAGNNSGTIIDCYSTKQVSGYYYAGGLVGRSSGLIRASYASGTVNAIASGAGGLIASNSGVVTACYANASIQGTYSVGGLVGVNSGAITASYATGFISDYGGGLVGGDDSGTITACFWDMQTSSRVDSSGGIGLTTKQMKTMSIFQNADWADRGWVMKDGLDYPHLSWEKTEGVSIPSAVIPLSGTGTAEDPYLISTSQEFALLSWYSGILDKHIKLTNDLDLEGCLLYPIGGLGIFVGDFDGNDYTLKNAVITQPENDYVGLFSNVSSGGHIRDLSVENVTIVGRYYVGALAGHNYRGTITNNYVKGSVTGYGYVGGLIGYNYAGLITACQADGAIVGYEPVGGLIGYNDWGTVKASHSSGFIDGVCDVGGLVGYNYGRITGSYASNSVSGSLGVGGLAGVNYGVDSYSSTISFCYSAGSVNGTGDHVGGLVGLNCGDINACYSRSYITGPFAYGLVGLNCPSVAIDLSYMSGFINDCFWDVQTSGTIYGADGLVPDPNGITGKTTGQMQMVSTFTDAGWDFAGEAANGTEDIWRMCMDGAGYPRLSWEFGRRGDFACPDGVGVEDLEALGMVWLTAEGQAGYSGACDANSDGRIDMADFEVLAGEWMGD